MGLPSPDYNTKEPSEYKLLGNNNNGSNYLFFPGVAAVKAKPKTVICMWHANIQGVPTWKMTALKQVNFHPEL